ncbi:hypothetical protein [Paenibacillus thalictri]|uniref:Uncharacterized protein n=1 Tax=Paenibacillus thalictri TaxID=2527873 RepID=A0A4Q9DJF3_9BACL|nr:hypothetical protein [Paenibacillus thalictri]TBL74006.1 hypothetical protein EYB31_26290 [Paenibacillus thalictri]
MFKLTCDKWSHDHGLQIIHADVRLTIDGDEVIDEPLCVDVGLPALLQSVLRDAEPNRWAAPEQWERMPFFCCGCGDPECRAFSFRVEHRGETVHVAEIDERQNGESRVLAEYDVPKDEYKAEILKAGRQFLSFVEDLDYHPYLADTVRLVRGLVDELTP